MTNFLYAVLMFLLFFFACEQKVRPAEIPENIRNKFNTLYPDAQNIHWYKEIKTYEVTFTNKKTNISISFDFDGNITETEEEITQREVPGEVLNMIDSKFSRATITSFNKIRSYGKLQYEADMKIKNENYKVFFTPEGKIIRQVLKKKNETTY
jgi:hypothetical protein